MTVSVADFYLFYFLRARDAGIDVGPGIDFPVPEICENESVERNLYESTNVGGWACAQQAGCLTPTWVEILSHTCNRVDRT